MTILAAVIVVVTLIVMTAGRQPAVLVLICALVVAGIAGIATPAELFAGLSNGGVITIAAMLMIAKGVLYTGVITRVTYRLLAGVQSTEQVLRRLIPPVGIVSALINTTPIVAMLIPAAKELEQQSGIPARGVLLPIAHATTPAGSATLIGTSSNLVIAGLAAPAGVGLKVFSFVPIAVPVALVGWAVLLIAAPLMLRGRAEQPERELAWRAEIPVEAGANAVGRTAADLGVRTTHEFELVEIQRWGALVGPDSVVQTDDVLVYRATESGVRMLWASPRFGHAAQALYMVSIATDESASVRDLEEGEDVQVVAAQSTKRLRDTPALSREMCLVTTSSADVLTDHPLVGLEHPRDEAGGLQHRDVRAIRYPVDRDLGSGGIRCRLGEFAVARSGCLHTPSSDSIPLRVKYRTKPAATIHSSGLISRALPAADRTTTHVTKPTPMPLAIE
jgi:hypothetical protein